MLLRGRGLDENRLVAYVRDQVTKQGDDLFSFRHAGRTLWATKKEPTTAGFFLDVLDYVLRHNCLGDLLRQFRIAALASYVD